MRNTELVKAWLMVHANGTELVTQRKEQARAVARLRFWTVYPLTALKTPLKEITDDL